MNLGLEQNQGERPSKVRAVARQGMEDAETKKLLSTLAKLSLSNAMQIRALRSILLEVHQVPAANPYIQEAMQATKKYAEAAKEMSPKDKEERLGLPHIHVWNALLAVATRNLEQRAKEQDPSHQESLAVLLEYASKYQEQGWKAIHHEVKYARVQKNFRPELKRLEINLMESSPSDKVWAIIKADLRRDQGVRELPGVAPAGDLERQLQRFLDDASGSAK